MAGLTVLDVKTRVKQQFGDESESQITNAMILNWINDAQNEIVNRSDELFQQKSSGNTITGTADYSLPTLAADIVRLHKVYYKGQTVEPISVQQAEETYPEKDTLPRPTGTPRHCWIWADRIYFEPAPDTTGAHLTIYWQKYPTAVSLDADPLTLPVRYHLKVVDYCIAKAAELDDDDERHNTKMAILNSDLDMMQRDNHWAQQNLYPFVTVSTEDQQYGQ